MGYLPRFLHIGDVASLCFLWRYDHNRDGRSLGLTSSHNFAMVPKTTWFGYWNWYVILYTPNGKLHRILTSLAFKNLMHPFQPFIVGQKIIGPLISAKFDAF